MNKNNKQQRENRKLTIFHTKLINITGKKITKINCTHYISSIISHAAVIKHCSKTAKDMKIFPFIICEVSHCKHNEM